ncbi:MAG: aminotransferase class V-fold PLP-dependent enzyme [Nitrospiraceae bacterium]
MTGKSDSRSEPSVELAEHWPLDPEVVFLNHGSYGACPNPVLEAQQRLREQLEQNPVRFLNRELERLLDESRQELAEFVGSDPVNLTFVPNTTTGVNAVLRSLRFKPGDELLTTSHAYNACMNALEFVAAGSRARVVQAPVPFPIESPEWVLEVVLDAVTSRTRLAVLDHVTSQTGLVFPIERLVRELHTRGIDTLVDGAHAPGMLPLNVEAIGAAYYVGNCHKWLCAPKGAAFLHVCPERQSGIRPLAISHGANSTRTDRSRFHLEFGWTGTHDPTAYLAVPVAIRFLGSLLPGGWPAVMTRNRALALKARQVLCRTLHLSTPCPDEMVGTLVTLPLPSTPEDSADPACTRDPLQESLYTKFRIETSVTGWPSSRQRLLRVPAHLYNSSAQYVRLAHALSELLGS